MPEAIAVPELAWVDAVLEPDVRVTKGSDTPGDQAPLTGRLLLGEPAAAALTAEHAKDPDLQAFIEGHGGRHEFTLVHLACSFRPADDEPFERASLEVRLARADGSEGPPPVAWSLWPLRESEPIDATTTAKVGADAKLVSASVERTVAVKRQDVWLEGFGELRPDPGWEFTTTRRVPIRGSYRLILVVMSDAGDAFTGRIDVTASVAHRLLGVLSYRARPAGSAQVSSRSD